MPLGQEAPLLDPSLSSVSRHRWDTHTLRAAQILEPCVLFTGLKVVAVFAQTQRKKIPCLPPKGLSFQAYVFLLRITFFFITLKVLSFSSEFKNKVNTQMTGYNLEEEGGIPPT